MIKKIHTFERAIITALIIMMIFVVTLSIGYFLIKKAHKIKPL